MISLSLSDLESAFSSGLPDHLRDPFTLELISATEARNGFGVGDELGLLKFLGRVADDYFASSSLYYPQMRGYLVSCASRVASRTDDAQKDLRSLAFDDHHLPVSSVMFYCAAYAFFCGESDQELKNVCDRLVSVCFQEEHLPDLVKDMNVFRSSLLRVLSEPILQAFETLTDKELALDLLCSFNKETVRDIFLLPYNAANGTVTYPLKNWFRLKLKTASHEAGYKRLYEGLGELAFLNPEAFGSIVLQEADTSPRAETPMLLFHVLASSKLTNYQDRQIFSSCFAGLLFSDDSTLRDNAVLYWKRPPQDAYTPEAHARLQESTATEIFSRLSIKAEPAHQDLALGYVDHILEGKKQSCLTPLGLYIASGPTPQRNEKALSQLERALEAYPYARNHLANEITRKFGRESAADLDAALSPEPSLVRLTHQMKMSYGKK